MRSRAPSRAGYRPRRGPTPRSRPRVGTFSLLIPRHKAQPTRGNAFPQIPVARESAHAQPPRRRAGRLDRPTHNPVGEARRVSLPRPPWKTLVEGSTATTLAAPATGNRAGSHDEASAAPAHTPHVRPRLAAPAPAHDGAKGREAFEAAQTPASLAPGCRRPARGALPSPRPSWPTAPLNGSRAPRRRSATR